MTTSNIGRPPKDPNDIQRRRAVTLDDATVDELKKWGKGELSGGIRALLAAARKARLKPRS